MQSASQSIAPDVRSTLSGINNVINLLSSRLPMTSYILAFLAVARHENESVDYYARICGCSSGAMSKRLNELGEMSSRDRSKAGYGLLEGPPNPLDRRLRMIRLSPKGRGLAAQIVGAMQRQPMSEAA
jgi:DNA-binding MarR family transcriptional regulator